MFENFEFVNPIFFWLLLALPVLVAWYLWKRNKQTATLKISSVKGFKSGKNWIARLKPILFVLRLLALAAIIVALARPRTVDESTRIKTTKGIDIVMAIDVSASMLARDLKPNRLEALKTVAARFIQARPNDRIGLVEYAGESVIFKKYGIQYRYRRRNRNWDGVRYCCKPIKRKPSKK